MMVEPLVIEQATIAGWQGVSKSVLVGDTPLRRELFFEHPAMRYQTQVVTPMAKEMYRNFKAAILLGEQGLYISGERKDGRSCALRICMKLLESEYPQIGAYYHCASASGVPNQKAAWQAMLSSTEHAFLSGDVIPLRERLVTKIVDDLRRRGTGYTAIWCVDNAQEIQERELEALFDLQDRLWARGVVLLTAMVADNQRDIRTFEAPPYDRSLLRHFFCKHFGLRGVTTAHDIEVILEAFDASEFPEGSDVRWTEFFFPQAYANGFRLAEQTLHVFETLSQCFPNAGQSKPTLGVIFNAIRWTLLRSAQLDAPEFNLQPEDWKRAVQYAVLRGNYTPPRLLMK
ncbi:hypothetical protein [Ralstonia sp. SET104]|uniref:hypothetical protein n=1 Tax=Ralstonia sp. SET104 TaxID=2448774 RepID=UPI000F57F4E6|nr:hypothetical protein [Ralstonia sp. SET104]GCB04409.1 hypothetical protein PSUB009319_20400 [Ralstonia sp. SET104]